MKLLVVLALTALLLVGEIQGDGGSLFRQLFRRMSKAVRKVVRDVRIKCTWSLGRSSPRCDLKSRGRRDAGQANDVITTPTPIPSLPDCSGFTPDLGEGVNFDIVRMTFDDVDGGPIAKGDGQLNDVEFNIFITSLNLIRGCLKKDTMAAYVPA